MISPETLIIGGRRGIGLVVNNYLKSIGHRVYTSSRNNSNDECHFQNELPSTNGIPRNLKIDNLIFAQRYRGSSGVDDFKVMIVGIENVIRHLKGNISHGGSVILLGSNTGSFIFDEQPASYHAIRSGIESLTRYYAVELGRLGIRCNCLVPGAVIKPENREFYSPENEVRVLIEKITPLKRIGKAEDIAGMVALLCSSDASFVTGQVIFVDGGLSIIGQESLARDLSNLKVPNRY